MDLRSYFIPIADAPEDWTPEWVLEGLIQKNAINFILGAPKSHKTQMRRYLLACAFARQAAWDLHATGIAPENALVYLSEDHIGAERGRTMNIMRSFGINVLPNITFVDRPLGFDLKNASHMKLLRKVVEEDGFDYVSFDPFINFHTGAENDSSEMAPIMKGLLDLSSITTILINHHTPKETKDTKGRSVGHSGRGSSAVAGAANSTILVERSGKSLKHKVSFEMKSAAEPEVIHLMIDDQTWHWVEAEELSPESIIHYIEKHPGCGKNQVAAALAANRNQTFEVIDKMLHDKVLDVREGARRKQKLYVTGIN